MNRLTIVVSFLVMNGLFLLSAGLAGTYTFVRSFMLFAALKRHYPVFLDGLDISGWNSWKAIEIIDSDICKDDHEIESMKGQIRLSKKVVLISIIGCFLGFIALGLFTLWGRT